MNFCSYDNPETLHLPTSLVYQQIGASSYHSVDVRSYLNAKALQRWTGRGSLIASPLRSADLTALNFSWAYLKDFIFAVEMTSLSHIHQMIKREVKFVSAQMIQEVWED